MIIKKLFLPFLTLLFVNSTNVSTKAVRLSLNNKTIEVPLLLANQMGIVKKYINQHNLSNGTVWMTIDNVNSHTLYNMIKYFKIIKNNKTLSPKVLFKKLCNKLNQELPGKLFKLFLATKILDVPTLHIALCTTMNAKLQKLKTTYFTYFTNLPTKTQREILYQYFLRTGKQFCLNTVIPPSASTDKEKLKKLKTLLKKDKIFDEKKATTMFEPFKQSDLHQLMIQGIIPQLNAKDLQVFDETGAIKTPKKFLHVCSYDYQKIISHVNIDDAAWMFADLPDRYNTQNFFNRIPEKHPLKEMIKNYTKKISRENYFNLPKKRFLEWFRLITQNNQLYVAAHDGIKDELEKNNDILISSSSSEESDSSDESGRSDDESSSDEYS